MIVAVNADLCNCVKKPEKKIQDFYGVWTRDLAIPVRCSTNWAMKPLMLGAGQLWVHMFPWKKLVLMIYEINHMNCVNEMKMKKRSSKWTQFMQLRKEAWKKIQEFNGVWTSDLAILVRCSTNWATKPLTLGAGQLWVHMFSWKKWVLMIYEINHSRSSYMIYFIYD